MGWLARQCQGAGVLLMLLVAGAPAAQGQAAPADGGVGAAGAGQGTVTFRFERPGLAVPRFVMTVRQDGSGSYEAEEMASALGGDAAATDAGAGAGGLTHVRRQIAVTPATVATIFKTAAAEKNFNTTCASKAKNIADTGMKTLSYEGPDGKGSCSYNYSENKKVVALTDLFLGIALTLDEGRKLAFKRRYDRLGLDAELDALAQSSDAGRAVELGNIAPLLRELATNADLMQRVQLRAAKLLDRVAEGK